MNVVFLKVQYYNCQKLFEILNIKNELKKSKVRIKKSTYKKQNTNIMKTLNDLFKSTKNSSETNVNKIMFDILKSQEKFTRTELKVEMFKKRFEMTENVIWNDKFLEDKKYEKTIEKLLITSRNSIDTFISKNNREKLFVDFGTENKMLLENDKYFLKLK